MNELQRAAISDLTEAVRYLESGRESVQYLAKCAEAPPQVEVDAPCKAGDHGYASPIESGNDVWYFVRNNMTVGIRDIDDDFVYRGQFANIGDFLSKYTPLVTQAAVWKQPEVRVGRYRAALNEEVYLLKVLNDMTARIYWPRTDNPAVTNLNHIREHWTYLGPLPDEA